MTRYRFPRHLVAVTDDTIAVVRQRADREQVAAFARRAADLAAQLDQYADHADAVGLDDHAALIRDVAAHVAEYAP